MARSANAGSRPAQNAVTTSILLGNLHCPSCVASIRDALQEACPDHIRWVSPNIVTSVVTVEHDAEASHRDMIAALFDAGFEICGATSSTGEAIFDPDSALALGEQGPSAPGPAPHHLDNIAEDEAQGPDDCCSPDQPKGKAVDDLNDMASPFKSLTGPLMRWISGPRAEHDGSSTIAEKIAKAHLDNCEQCRQLRDTGKPTPAAPHAEHARDARDSSDDATLHDESSHAGSRPSSSARKQSTAESTAESSRLRPTSMDRSFVTVEGEDAPSNKPIWRANLAIGGMTCAVCVNAIVDGLRKKDWVLKSTVNLISNSATVDFDDKSKEDAIVEAIEDLGYDATIDTVTRLNPPKTKVAQHDGGEGEALDAQESHERTVEIRIDGLYCEHCPGRIVRSLQGFRRPSLNILTEPTPQRPIVKLRYVPEAPVFTIRSILAAIEASDGALTAKIHHPPTLEERSKMIQRKHQRHILVRVVATGIVAIPTFVIGIVYMSLLPSSDHGRMFMMMPWTSGISRAQIALFIMATPVYFFAADVFHRRAFKEIRTLWRRSSRIPFLQRFYRFGSMNTLMSLGTTIAYVSSIGQMIASWVHHDTEVSDTSFYFDSVVFLTFFLLCGRLIESYSKSRTGDAVEMLGRLRPTTAILESIPSEGKDKTMEAVTSTTGNSTPRHVEADLLDFGDVVRVLHGASPPADGVIVQGSSNFDESSLTGESRLVPKTLGDSVFSGTVNKDAPVLVRVTGAAGTSMLDQIVAVVREGQTKRAPMEQIADLLTTYFVPVVTLVAILTWITWLSLGLSGLVPDHYLDVTSGGWVAFALQFAISVFVVACPCGLGLAAPTAIFVAGGMAAKYGILAKGGGEAFEKASRIDCVVFDKTGTLTVGGEPTVTDSVLLDRAGNVLDASDTGAASTRSDLLAALKAVEENSGHPIAKAIVSFSLTDAAASGRRGRADDLQEIAGRGMRATYHNEAGQDRSFDLVVGNEALMRDYGVVVPAHTAALLQQWKVEAKSVALAATRPLRAGDDEPWTLSAALSISDPLRPEAASILAALQARGVLVYMLSGDNAVTAAAVARQLGIPADQVIAEVLPTEKAAKIQSLQSSLEPRTTIFGRTAKTGGSSSRRAVVAMVGDGINDSPALTQADVGIAVGSGSDVAISSADFVLVNSNLQAVVTLLELSRVVFRRIAFNFGWALVYNVLAVPIAAGALYPIRTSAHNHVRLDPVWASLAMALSSISVVLSSLSLRSRIPGIGFRATVIKAPRS